MWGGYYHGKCKNRGKGEKKADGIFMYILVKI
jgi:hypothetical protein